MYNGIIDNPNSGSKCYAIKHKNIYFIVRNMYSSDMFDLISGLALYITELGFHTVTNSCDM